MPLLEVRNLVKEFTAAAGPVPRGTPSSAPWTT